MLVQVVHRGLRRAMKSVLSPKELGTAIGVSESSLKRWADDGTLEVARTAGGHRRIHLSEAVRFIRDSGFTVQRPEILGLDDLVRVGRGTSRSAVRERFYEAIHEGRAEEAHGLALSLFMEGVSVAQLVDQVIAPAMFEIGELWQHSPEGIFREHRASDICNQALNRVRGLTPTGRNRPVAIGAAPGDDPYVLPSLMAAAVAADENWAEVNLGAQTPMSVLAQAAVDCDASLVWVAMSVMRPTQRSSELVEALVQSLRSQGSEASVVVGGPALRGESRPPSEKACLASTMAEFAAFARGLRTARRDGLADASRV